MDNNHLRKAGLKITHPRIRIIQALQSSPQRHLSAEQIYKILLEGEEDIGLATVYRVLTQFEAAGIVKRHHFEGGLSVFELAEGEQHDHLVCVKCDAVEEFGDEIINQRLTDIAAQLNFVSLEHKLVIYGLCQKCALEKN